MFPLHCLPSDIYQIGECCLSPSSGAHCKRPWRLQRTSPLDTILRVTVRANQSGPQTISFAYMWKPIRIIDFSCYPWHSLPTTTISPRPPVSHHSKPKYFYVEICSASVAFCYELPLCCSVWQVSVACYLRWHCLSRLQCPSKVHAGSYAFKGPVPTTTCLHPPILFHLCHFI